MVTNRAFRAFAIAAGAVALLSAAAAEPVAIHVQRLIESLSPPLSQKVRMPFNDAERFNWHYIPRSRRGIAIGELSPSQRELLHAVLRTGLSASGYQKANGILELEPILGRLEGGGNRRNPERYYLSIFGEPSQTPWGWRFEGHHLSLNATLAPSGASFTPMFLGANPARVPGGPRAGWQVLGSEENLGRSLLASLAANQRERALISSRAPFDIVTGTDRRFTLEKFEGLPAAAMNAEQRQMLLQLIRTYVGNAPAAIADSEMQKIQTAGIEKLHFAWAGGDRRGQGHYYRVHGPTILIEYDNTQDGANHIHTVWRKPGGDFGDDVLARHYAEAPHHAARASARARRLKPPPH